MAFYCYGCFSGFIPKRNKQIRKYGHNLKSWVIHQNISYRISTNIITHILLESYNIRINDNMVVYFRERLSELYKETYEEIKRDIFNGDLIHADETSVTLRGLLPAYVWVFTTMDSVVYLLRPNREADFLTDLLKGFKGVLVSDFYPGYDSIDCLQQKCLIHLIRDLNNDLFKNQLDTEFKALVINFAQLLRKIVETINRYGLKKRHLNKHKNDVKKFNAHIFRQNYESELAISYQKRFKKNRYKLFTFLEHDGIPWNNNNAEHAITSFALYRRTADKLYTEKTLNEYLLLLSIEQTCKCRGISFLDFLRSRAKSIEDFCK
jgi:hypothetical protein